MNDNRSDILMTLIEREVFWLRKYIDSMANARLLFLQQGHTDVNFAVGLMRPLPQIKKQVAL